MNGVYNYTERDGQLRYRPMNPGPFPVDRAAARAGNADADASVTIVARGGKVRTRSLKSPEAKEEEQTLNPPERSYDCPNYETCLGLAAALDWKSFTCQGCCGTVNQQLLWRAHHRIRNNPSLSKLCNLPVLTSS